MTITPTRYLDTEANMSDRNPTVEGWLEQFGITDWEFRLVDLHTIDDTLSTRNQARFKAEDSQVIAQYGHAAACGAKFPPVVLAKVDGKLVTVDGNHRRKGLPLGGVHLHPAYIIDPPKALRDLMTRTANTTNGFAFTDEEKRKIVIDLHVEGQLTQAQISLQSGLSEAQVRTICRAQDARDRAADMRLANRISDGDMEAIGRLSSDAPYDMLVAFQAAHKPLKQRDLQKLVAEANKQRSDFAALRVVEDGLAIRKAEASKVTKVTSDYAKLTRALGGILNCNPLAVAIECQDRQALIDKIDDAVNRLTEIAAGL